MTIELRVPISPTPSFINQVLLQAASLRRFHPDAKVQAYVGQSVADRGAPEMRLVHDAFAAHRIGYEWIVGREFDQWADNRAPFLGTINRRWRETTADTVIIADADIIFTGTLDDVLCRDAVQGVQAHVPPMSNDQFRYLLAICEAPEPPFNVPYSGAGFMAPPNAKSLFYPNSGMVALPRAHFEAMVPHYHFAINRMRSAMQDHYWFDQLALAVAAAKAKVPVHSLPVKFNFPNQTEFEEHYPEDLRDVRVIHYLREHLTSRSRDFESLSALRRLANRSDLTGSHEILRRAIATNLSTLEPPPLGSPGTEPPWA